MEEVTTRFNSNLMRLGEAVRMIPMTLKRRETTLPTAMEAGHLPEPTFKGTVTWLECTPLHILSLIHI